MQEAPATNVNMTIIGAKDIGEETFCNIQASYSELKRFKRNGKIYDLKVNPYICEIKII